MHTIRKAKRVITSTKTTEGAGFTVHRPFPTQQLMDFDPFLLLDEMGPMQLKPGDSTGAPDHPHRGFETVTYLLSGSMEHKDSQGNHGKLHPGDVQWMTAGSGVIHSELTAASFVETGGVLHGLQLWVNLPREDKMVRPRYQDIPASQLPIVQTPDKCGQVKIIAGEAFGQKAVIETRTPILYFHITLQANGDVQIPTPADFQVFAYVISGTGTFGVDHQPAQAQQAVIFDTGDSLQLKNTGAEELSVIIVGGKPLHEPIARYGPFVMNSESEIHQAIQDYRSGHFGEITF